MSNRKIFPSFQPLALLDRMLQQVELSPRQHERVRTSYKAVAEVLKSSKTFGALFVSLDIKPQGSVRAGTTIKPQGHHEFDLDVLCLLLLRQNNFSPAEVWKLAWDALGEHETYRAMRQPKNRCIRLCYAGDYHLDVTPAVPDSARPEPALFVPDKPLSLWSSSNPIGFCDHWFMKIAERLPSTIVKLAANEGRVLINSCRIEDLPPANAFEKHPLQRLVQLVKYDRDQRFLADAKFRPSSILLTTLVARAYENTLSEAHDSLETFLASVIGKIPRFVQVVEQETKALYIVLNPVNEDENFAENWRAADYLEFLAWHADLLKRTTTMLFATMQGLDNALKMLEQSFPASKSMEVGKQLGNEIRRLHDSNQLTVRSTVGSVSASIVVPSTIFYGNDN